jgi:pyrroline-5-carboxylate reductase
MKFSSILVYEPDPEVASALKARYPDISIADSLSLPAQQDIIMLAVHPPVMMETLDLIRQSVGEGSMVVSLAPKITLEKISGILETKKVVRMIPNATSFINKGYNPVSFQDQFPEEDKKSIMRLFRKLGKTIEVEESMLEGYAMISAMLPTYFWFQWKKMEELAVQMGFEEAEAKKVIRNTLKRSGSLYYRSSLTPDEVMDLIPVKPIGAHEDQIREIYENRLMELYGKIKP